MLFQQKYGGRFVLLSRRTGDLIVLLIAIVGDKLHPQFDFSLASFQNHFGKKSNLSSIHYDMLAHLCKCVN